MKDLTRRQFLRFGAGLGAAASAAGLAACQGDGAGASSNDANSSDGTIELTYWYCWTDLIKENNEERIQEFNDTVGKEKGIHVTAESQGSYDDLNAKLKSAFVAGEAPDVCVMVINSTKVFADGGMIQPIDDVIATDDLNDFWPGLMDNCKVDGSLYGVPYLRSTPVLYYNKTLFQKAGLDATAAPATWDDMVKASDALAAAGAKGYGFYS
ncbi:MAG: extracellular solute-binding protein [Atopobiaceae bacterium]|nr:extracellular solute-binding protein [Atopobiaceae bacterium]MDY5274521.1 extracellular solute-binding protein [Atopobiaceae bacterium]